MQWIFPSNTVGVGVLDDPFQTKSYSVFGADAHGAPLRVCEYDIVSS